MDLVSMLREPQSSGSNLVDALRTGSFPERQPSQQRDFGIPEDELRADIESLIAAKVPEEKILKSIELHPDITDKEGAQEFAKNIIHNGT